MTRNSRGVSDKKSNRNDEPHLNSEIISIDCLYVYRKVSRIAIFIGIAVRVKCHTHYSPIWHTKFNFQACPQSQTEFTNKLPDLCKQIGHRRFALMCMHRSCPCQNDERPLSSTEILSGAHTNTRQRKRMSLKERENERHTSVSPKSHARCQHRRHTSAFISFSEANQMEAHRERY